MIAVRNVLALIVLVSYLACRAEARTWEVVRDPEIVSDQIGALVAQAASGDSFQIGPGIYYEHIFAGDRSLTFLGSGVGLTVLDGSMPIERREGSVLYSLENQCGALTLQDITLQNGRGSYPIGPGAVTRGGALYWDDFYGDHSNLDIRFCELRDNQVGYPAMGYGAAIWADGLNQVTMEDCRVAGNTNSDPSSGVLFFDVDVDVVVLRCTFDLETWGATAITAAAMTHLRVEESSFESTSPASDDCLVLDCDTVDLVGNTFIDRGSGATATRIHFAFNGVPGEHPVQTMRLERNLFWFAAGPDSAAEPTVRLLSDNQQLTVEQNTFVRCGLLTDGGGQAATVRNNIFYRSQARILQHRGGIVQCNDSWPGEIELGQGGYISMDNLRADPRFCDEAGGDFTIADTSPCTAEHSPNGCGLIGLYGKACGDTPVETVSWGRLKSLYRGK